MGREIENPRIQIWKASKSIFHRLGEQDPESEEERPGPGSHGQGLSQSGSASPRGLPALRSPTLFRPHSCRPRGTHSVPQPSQTPRGSSGVARCHAAARVWPWLFGHAGWGRKGEGPGAGQRGGGLTRCWSLGQSASPLGASPLVCSRG